MIRRFGILCCAVLAVALAAGGPAWADGGFSRWLSGVRAEAVREGVSPAMADAALRSVRFLPKVIALDRKQPESTRSFVRYRDGILSADRISRGRALYQKHRALLREVERETGVPAAVIVALWGIETNYGQNTGGYGTLSALATLGYDGRRSAYFRGELIAALKILDQGHVRIDSMRGSWAGAMGQCQFMPSSFLRFAKDQNGDGRRDIWGSMPDVFGSSANYLRKSGWKSGERWGRAVLVPKKLRKSLIGLDVSKGLDEWVQLGVTLPDTSRLPSSRGMKASIVQPDGPEGPSYLVYDNYRVLMNWNRSTYFATTVGLLSDLIAK